MSRNLLHKSKLDEFKSWLDSQEIPQRPARGQFEVLQVQVKAPQWFCLWDRIKATEHYTVDIRLEPTVRRFIRESRGD